MKRNLLFKRIGGKSRRAIGCWLILVFVLTACQNQEEPKLSIASTTNTKNVVMIMVDSMTEELVDTSIKTGEFPALKFLIENGQKYGDLVAPFPSMSVSIEATLITGQMPRDHHIPGLTWYNSSENKMVNYGTSFESMRKLGFKESLNNAFYHLNRTHLNKQSSTIFEELQDKGVTTGSVNTLLFRGRTKHSLEGPEIFHNMLGLPEQIKTYGPDVFAFGSLSRPEELKHEQLNDGYLQRGGFTDTYAAEVISKLMTTKQQPQFLLAFFPEMDKKTHRKGPPYVKGFKKVDEDLQRILNVYENWDDALKNNIFILIGDHGQDHLVADEDQVKIKLDDLYQDFEIAAFKETPSDGNIVIANNHRMAFVYPLNNKIQRKELAKAGIQDKRMALSALLQDDWIYVWNADQQFLRFKKEGNWTDAYHQSWTIEGEAEVLDFDMNNKEKIINFKEYPDALNQLHSALYSQPDAVVLTAKPGYLVYSETAPVHDGGGEHGGMHKNDTHAALIIAGTEEEPKYRRMIDLKDYVQSLLIPEKEISLMH